jgi:MerC mercury resistance protein
MLASVTSNGRIDRLAIGLSGLCLVHCVASAVLVLMLASAGGLLVDPRIHEFGLALAIMLGALGLGRGIFEHGFLMPSAIGGIGLGTMAGSLTFPHGAEEVVISVFGVLVLALGHDLNRRAAH